MAEDRRLADRAFRELQDTRHAENLDRFEVVTRRLDVIDKHISDSQRDRQEMRKEMKTNTEITAAIKADTSAIVGFWQSMRAWRIFLAWAIPIVVSIISVYVTLAVKR